MGRLVDQEAKKRGHEIEGVCDRHAAHAISLAELAKRSDILIDFSSSDNVHHSIQEAAKAQKNIVIGTTGWNHQDQARKIAKEAGIGILFSPNFSIGVLLFKKLVREAAKLFHNVDGYDIAGFEIHHSKKQDAPSGTAKALADSIVIEWPSKTEILYDTPEGQIKPHQLHFTSLRIGSCPGTHEIIIDSPCDTITLRHEAKNREGFALGAVIAAEQLFGKQGYFTMEDLLK